MLASARRRAGMQQEEEKNCRFDGGRQRARTALSLRHVMCAPPVSQVSHRMNGCPFHCAHEHWGTTMAATTELVRGGENEFKIPTAARPLFALLRSRLQDAFSDLPVCDDAVRWWPRLAADVAVDLLLLVGLLLLLRGLLLPAAKKRRAFISSRASQMLQRRTTFPFAASSRF